MRWLFCLLITMPTFGYAQSYEEVVNIVELKDFRALQKLVGVETANLISLPIATDYQWFYITSHKNRKNHDYFGLDVIVLENLIVFANVKTIEGEGKLGSLSDTLPKKPLLNCYIKNEPSYGAFVGVHSFHYGFNFNPSSFDKDKDWISEPYGKSCGFGGFHPPMKSKMDSVVEAGDDITLDTWLRSYIPALQAYAVEGFYKLHGKTCSMSEEQLRLIKLIKKSEASVNACGGCFFFSVALKEALEPFNFYCHK